MTRSTAFPLPIPPQVPSAAMGRAWRMVCGCVLGLSMNSAFAVAEPGSALTQVGYREALKWFNSQKYDSPGIWLCGYSLARPDYSVAPKAPRLLVEIDEHFLYLKTGGQLVELTSGAQSNNRVEYQNASADMRVTLNILKRNNFSEYQESHDRQVEARIEIAGQVETLKLKGQSCGT